MARLLKNGLTRDQNRLLKAVSGGGALRQDPRWPSLVVVLGENETFRTNIAVVHRLIFFGLLARLGNGILDVEITQRGFAKLGEFPGFPKSRLPAALHPTTRALALEKLAELRCIGFEDPVDALLAIGFETDENGEWKHPTAVRVDCLKAAAPFLRPKLQAILARSDSGKGHVEWLKELREYVDTEEREEGPVIDVTPNGEDHEEELEDEPGEPGQWTPSGK